MTVFDSLLVWSTVFGTSIIVLYLLIRMLRVAAGNLGPAELILANRIAIGLIVWACAMVVYSRTIGLSFPSLIPVLAIPWSLGLWLMFWPSTSRILSAVPLHWLVALSFYRVAGFIFVYCYYFCGTLSRGFALNAGWGDVLTGVLAVPMAWVIWKRVPFTAIALIVWSIIGIGDLIVAPASAAIYGAGKLNEFPISLIPLFLGPPFGILLHVVTLRVAWLQRPLS